MLQPQDQENQLPSHPGQVSQDSDNVASLARNPATTKNEVP